jgi:ubiquinone/menaquinone biosynthesis C-methylase UbiE
MAERVGSQGRVVGVDISSTILAVAQDRSGHILNLRFEVGDAQTMDLGEDVFDLVYSRFGVMFFQDVIAAFSNLNRALKPTGRLMFLCWHAAAENPWMQQPVTAI